MKRLTLAVMATLLLAGPAGAQQPAQGPYEFMLAKLAAAGGRFDEALDLMNAVIAKNPGNTILLYERATLLMEAGRADRAEAELRKVVASAPDFYDAQRALGRMILERAGNDLKRVDEALVYLRAAFKLNPDDLATGMAVSQILANTNRASEAATVLEQMLERAPDQRAINYAYAQTLTKLGRGDESKQFLERAVLVDPTFTPAVLQLVDIYEHENDWKKAAEILQPLIEEDPLNLDLQRRQAFSYLRGGMAEQARARFKALVDADPNDIRSKYYLAESLSDLEQYAEADKMYRVLLEKTPDDPDLLASFGISQLGQHKFDDAAKTFHLLLGLRDLPPNLKALAETQLASIELQKGNYAAALANARPVLVFDDRPNAQAINIALSALRKEKKYAEAVVLLQPLAEKYGADPFVNARYVEMLVLSGNKEKANQVAVIQGKFGPRNTVAVAEAYIQAADYKDAIALVTEALKTKPDEIDLQFALGSAYERSGDRAAAEKAFLDLIDRHPNHAPSLNYLGYMWAEAAVHLDRAAEMLKNAVNQEPDNGAYLDSLGWVYYQQGKLDLAQKYLADATRLLPRDATVQQHLGDVYAKRGDLAKALSIYRAALSLEPEPKDEASIRAKIADLEQRSQNAQRR